MMRDFEWASDKPLRSELVVRAAAGFGVFFAIACILLALGYFQYSAMFLGIVIVASVIVVRKTPATKVRVEGTWVFYGSSVRADLEGLLQVKESRQFGTEEIISLVGSKSNSAIPTKGIPENIKSELLSVLRERIKPGG